MQILSVKKSILLDLFAHELNFINYLAKLPNNISLTIDSRFVPPQSIFFALKGDISDGHDFIHDAIKAGAVIIFASNLSAKEFASKDILVIHVNDTLACFSEIAHRHLMSMKALRIGITGSNGKTTVKEMTKAALSAVLGKDAVYANQGTFNNHFGVPISAVEVNSNHKVAIFEMGMNHAGEISELCNIVKPELALITNIGVAHAGNFSDGIKGVQRAKGELFDALGEQGRAIVNIDDELVAILAKKHNFKSMTTFGKNASANLCLVDRSLTNKTSQHVTINIEGRKLSFFIPLLGEHNALNALAALAIIRELDLDIEKAALGLNNMILNTGRLSVTHTKNYTVVNDGYNANPISMKAGIAACMELEAKRRIAVIGAMGELGDSSDTLHFEMGTVLAENFDAIFACGFLVKPLLKGAKSHGLKEDRQFYKDSSEELISPLKNYIEAGDLIFIKGSKSTRMQAVAQALIGE